MNKFTKIEPQSLKKLAIDYSTLDYVKAQT